MKTLLACKAILIATCFAFITACSSITIEEESFLRDRQYSILYQIIRYESSTTEQISERTFYSVDSIEKSLINLHEKGFVESVSGNWLITDKFRSEDPDYVTSLEQFRMDDAQSDLPDHELSLELIDDGRVQIAAYLSKAPRETLVIFPGNGFNIVPDILEIRTFLSPGRNIFVMDYPGMGDSHGNLTIDSLRTSTNNFFNYVTGHESVENTKVAIYGFSLGGFVATEIASQYPMDALILDSTAPDMQSWIDANVPLYAKFFVRVKVDEELGSISNTNAISEITSPVLFIAGSSDNITPPSFMSTLQNSAKNAIFTEKVILNEVSHGESLDHKEFKNAIDKFIEKAIKTNSNE